MNREAFETKLQDLLDRRMAPQSDPEVSRIVSAQPELASVLAAYTAFASLRRACPTPSRDLDARILTELGNAPIASPRRAPAWLAPFVAVAATLLIATTLAFLAEREGEQAVVAVPDTPPTLVEAAPPQPAAPSLNRLTQRAADNYRELAASTGESLSSALSVVQSSKKPVETRDDDQWLRRVPDGLRPLSNSTSGAVFSLMRVVPASQDPEREQY